MEAPLKKSRWAKVFTIEMLPDNVILRLLDHMNATDALAFSQTCRRFSHLYQRATRLPMSDDVISHLFKQYLNAADAFAFSQTNKQISHVYGSIKHINFQNTFSNGLSLGTPLNSFLINHPSPQLLQRVDFSGCHWVRKTLLHSFLGCCASLKKLFVAETHLSLWQIGSVLHKNKGITSLSFTLRKDDFDLVLSKNEKEKSNQFQLDSLQKLKKIEVIVAEGCSFPDLLNILRYCVNCEEIVALRVPAPDLHLQGQEIGPFRRLKSVVFIASPNPLYAFNDFFNVEEAEEHPELSTFWSNVLPINRLKTTDHGIVNLRWNVSGPQTPLDIHFTDGDASTRYASLRSLYEPRPVFMRNPKWSKQLKLVSCYYDGQFFRAFCENHKEIEVLKLMFSEKPRLEDGSRDPTDRASPEVWDQASWKELSELKVLALDAQLIPVSLEKPYIAAVMQSCKIEEIEIFHNSVRGQLQWNINEMELSAIAQCGTLKRFTLSNLNVKSGQFLKEILEKCTQLESLRIFDIGDRVCCYSKTLEKALPLAKNLKTFCMFAQKVDFPVMENLLISLGKCPSLSRLGIVWPVCSWIMSEIQFSDAFFKLCCNLKQLVALFGVFNVSDTLCQATNKKLRDSFTKHRQAFCCDLQSRTRYIDQNTQAGYESEVLPLIHSDTLIRFRSQVATLPYDLESILNLQ